MLNKALLHLQRIAVRKDCHVVLLLHVKKQRNFCDYGVNHLCRAKTFRYLKVCQCLRTFSCDQSNDMTSGRSLLEQKHEEYQQSIKLMEDFLTSVGISGEKGLWIFGYGSLLWKVNFKYDVEKIGYIKGYVRRFWQGSTDHRGTPEKPGRVATIVPAKDNNQSLWGIAYHIPPMHVKETLNVLNFREKGGYSLKKVELLTADTPSQAIEVLLYVANEGNSDYGGDHDLSHIALQIAQAVGPSGSNREYLFNLAEVLRRKNLASSDDAQHALELEKMVKSILHNNEK